MEVKRSNRFATIDFLRGIAIWMMLLLHLLMRVYDRSWVDDPTQMAQARVIVIVILVFALYLGGWCGFFLLISSIGNMISMQKQLARGKTVGELVLKQVIGGFILLFFAFLTESIIGYHAWLGELPWGTEPLIDHLYRAFHMETIHTVAWCVIINGIVQGFLSMNGGYKKIRRNMLIYAILSIIIIAATPLVWNFASRIIPGYPFAQPDGRPYIVQYPIIGQSTIGDYIKLFFLLPLAGHPEPIFPFLSVSFIGSIIGLLLTEEHPSIKLLFYGIIISGLAVLVGIGGFGYAIAIGQQDIGNFLGNTWNIPGLDSWLWWFLILTGSQVFSTLIILRMIEFRGKAVPFAKKTTYFRRFGLIAFSVYNFQFIDFIPRYILTKITGIDALHSRVNGNLCLILMVGVFLTWAIVMWLWEKVNYIGGMEWMISVIAKLILPGKVKSKSTQANQVQEQDNFSQNQKRVHKTPWWKTDRINIQGTLYDANFINIVPPEKVDHKNLKDSKLAFQISLLSPFLLIGSIFALDIAIESIAIEGKNKYNKWAIALSILGIVIFIAGFISLTFMSGLAL
ncbi:hypothetical protein [Candidatus Harpocratesius sp.]